jgi:hypothetical protein
MADADKNLTEHLLSLELALQTREVRSAKTKLRDLLAPDFREFGRSGLAYTLGDIISRLVAEAGPANNTAILDFAISRLSDTIVLATYHGTRLDQDGTTLFTNRSSIWRLDEDGKWRMVFHQGTAAAS